MKKAAGRQGEKTSPISGNYQDSVIRNMLDVLIVASPEGIIQMLNPSALAILEYGEGELTGKSLTALFPPGTRMFNFLKSELLGRERHFKNVETEVLTKNGRKVPIILSVSYFMNEAGVLEGLIYTAKDMREQKKTEAERQRLHTQVSQSAKMAAVGQLAGGIAHEINNPLGVILGFAQSASRHVKVGEPLHLPLQSIIREAMRCRNLVQDLLTFSRVEKSESELVDPGKALETALNLIKAQATVRDVTFEVERPQGLPLVQLNKNQFQQVLINLANNAVDAMPQGGKLSISLKAVKEFLQEWVQVEVRDTGIGMTREVQERIFEPFFTTKEVGKGTGLGLSLVYEIVKKHNGNIRCESAPGKGTVFFIRFPAAKHQG